MAKIRLFVAIKISDDTKDYLLALQKKFLGLGDFKFVKEFHLTLKFLGYADEGDIEKIDSLMKEIKYKKFELCLSEIGVFPNVGSARVLWVGTEGNVRGLWELVENSLKKDYGSEERFKEHITLARIKHVDNKEGFKNLLKETAAKKIKFVVEYFRLVKSELRREGPIYTDLKIYSLGK